MKPLLLCILMGVTGCFGFVLIFGAPYLPTLTKQAKIALDLLDLKPGQTMLELGSGDGKILLLAAKRGWNVVGYELNPILVLVTWLRTYRYRKQVTIVWGDFFRKTWQPAEGVFSFNLNRHMAKVDRKITDSVRGPLRVVSFAAAIPGKKSIEERQGVWLYLYDKE